MARRLEPLLLGLAVPAACLASIATGQDANGDLHGTPFTVPLRLQVLTGGALVALLVPAPHRAPNPRQRA